MLADEDLIVNNDNGRQLSCRPFVFCAYNLRARGSRSRLRPLPFVLLGVIIGLGRTAGSGLAALLRTALMLLLRVSLLLLFAVLFLLAERVVFVFACLILLIIRCGVGAPWIRHMQKLLIDQC